MTSSIIMMLIIVGPITIFFSLRLIDNNCSCFALCMCTHTRLAYDPPPPLRLYIQLAAHVCYYCVCGFKVHC